MRLLGLVAMLGQPVFGWIWSRWLVQPYENWAEVRRLDMPNLTFQTDNANKQTTPPFRWNYPGNEVTYNTDSYNTVRATDNLTTKIFWDK